jgi:hypothetical protein
MVHEYNENAFQCRYNHQDVLISFFFGKPFAKLKIDRAGRAGKKASFLSGSSVGRFSVSGRKKKQ